MASRVFLCVSFAALNVVAASKALSIHHAFSPYFEIRTTLTLRAKVTKFDWMNPHPYLYVDAKNSSGEIQQWSIEFSDINRLQRVGLYKDSIKPGDEIIVVCLPAKSDGRFEYLDANANHPADYAKRNRFARAKEVTLAHGKHVIVP